MSLVLELINDYLSLSFDDLNMRWADRYDKVPKVFEVVEYLKRTGTLDRMIDSRPLNKERAVFLERTKTGYRVFMLFRGMEVNESEFDNLEAAVTEKLDRTLDGLGGRMRGC